MIKCNGIIVGLVKEPTVQSVAQQCVEFLNTHRYLLNVGAVFQVENMDFLTLKDFNLDDTKDIKLVAQFIDYNMNNCFVGV